MLLVYIFVMNDIYGDKTAHVPHDVLLYTNQK